MLSDVSPQAILSTSSCNLNMSVASPATRSSTQALWLSQTGSYLFSTALKRLFLISSAPFVATMISTLTNASPAPNANTPAATWPWPIS